MSRSGSVKVVQAARPANDDSFALSLKEIEAMERQRLARIAEEERQRVARARRAAEEAEAKLRIEKTKAAAAERAAEQEAELAAIRTREAARLCDAKAMAIVEIERIAAEGRVRIEEIEKQRRHDLAIETLRLSAHGTGTKRTIVGALSGAFVAIVALVSVHALVVAPAADARVARVTSVVAERDQEIQKLRGDVDSQASKMTSLRNEVKALQTALDAASRKAADVTPPKPLKAGALPSRAADPKRDANYGMNLCPPGVVDDPICIPNPLPKKSP